MWPSRSLSATKGPPPTTLISKAGRGPTGLRNPQGTLLAARNKLGQGCACHGLVLSFSPPPPRERGPLPVSNGTLRSIVSYSQGWWPGSRLHYSAIQENFLAFFLALAPPPPGPAGNPDIVLLAGDLSYADGWGWKWDSWGRCGSSSSFGIYCLHDGFGVWPSFWGIASGRAHSVRLRMKLKKPGIGSPTHF